MRVFHKVSDGLESVLMLVCLARTTCDQGSRRFKFARFDRLSMAVVGGADEANSPGTLEDTVYQLHLSRRRYLFRRFLAKLKENESELVASWQVFPHEKESRYTIADNNPNPIAKLQNSNFGLLVSGNFSAGRDYLFRCHCSVVFLLWPSSNR